MRSGDEARPPGEGDRGRTPWRGPGPAAFRRGIAAAGIVMLSLLAACRADRVSEAGGFCEAEPVAPVAPPVYTFEGEPLNLDRAARERVDRWVEFFRDERPDLFTRFLRRAGRYEERILEALRTDGLPEDILYLSMIESGMDPTAYSRSHAVGLWQFLASTGTVYGLEVDGLVDDRRHPERSTGAAITYLSDLHEQFGDWFLAAAAYNGGPTRLRRAIRRSGHRDYWTLVEDGLLPRETSEYVPKILAAAWLGRQPGLHGFGLVPRAAAPAVATVRLFGRNRLGVVAAAAGVPEEKLRALNPWLVGEVTPAGRWTEVLLPAGTLDRFEEVYALIPAHHRSGTLAHRVLRGETLGAIARTYGVTVGGLVAANPEVDPRRLRPGQEIRVPAEAPEAPALAREGTAREGTE